MFYYNKYQKYKNIKKMLPPVNIYIIFFLKTMIYLVEMVKYFKDCC
jgi:hypothetical protein